MASEMAELNGNDPSLAMNEPGLVVNGGLGEETPVGDDFHQVNGLAVAGPSSSAHPTSDPSYDDVFPALPCGALAPTPALTTSFASASSAGPKSHPKIRSSNVTIVFRVASDERRYSASRRISEQNELSKIAADIMAKTNTDIQLTSSKDGSLTFLISGKDEATSQAKRLLTSEFQAQVVFQLSIPKEHHRFILGKGGKKLIDLEQNTGTKIQIPKQDEESDLIRITGTREAIDKAAHEIQVISNQAFSRSVDRIDIPKVFHPFIMGPFGKTLEAIMKETGAKVNVPPQSVNKDEISITGDRNSVKAAKDRVSAIYQDKVSKTETVSIEVKKHQHKYIVGPKGHTLNEIMELTGVSVEMPPSDSTSETVVLRGEPDILPEALSVLYRKAHSETEDEIEVPGWIQRHILGHRGIKFQELSQEFPKVNVNFEIEENRIKLSGPVADVKKAIQLLKERAAEIEEQLQVEEIQVADSKHIKYIVGKNGANLKQIREDTKATIQVISSEGETKSAQANSAQYIRVEGSKEAVAKAKSEIESLLKKLENEVTYELLIERRFYGQIIGSKGENIREIRNKFNQVMIVFPEQNDQSEKVTIRGAKKDAEQCYKHLSQMNKELLFNNYRLEVPIFKQLLQFQGKDSVKKIREDIPGCRIDLPTETSPGVMLITGPKDKVEKVRDRITALQSNLSDMSQVDLIIPSKIHNYVLGSKGKNIKQIMAECGGVLINFPPEGSGSDKVQIWGPKECVQKAKQKLVEMSNFYQTNNYSEELKVKVEHHRYLIGKNGSNINKLREQAQVRLHFASDSGSGAQGDNSDRVLITGKKEEVKKARAILDAKIAELEKISEAEMRIEPKYHHLFVARRAAVCKQLFDDYGGVNVSFPHQSDKQNDRITLKGPKECLEPVKQRILEIIADFDAQVSIEVEIDASHHRHLLGPRNKVNVLQHDLDVKIKFPSRPSKAEQLNGGSPAEAAEETESGKSVAASNTITITGRKENCEKAREALLALVPVTLTVDIPFEFHRFVIGQKGSEVRDLMDKFQVQIRVPPATEKSDTISVIGTAENARRAQEALKEKLLKLEGEKADREARNHQVSFQVDPLYHPKIIGKRGAVISKIRAKFDVQIQVPESRSGGQEGADVITITGYEKNANEAKAHILAIVKELEDLVSEEMNLDARIHARLIGARGKNIRRIMDQFSVDIRFPRANNGENPDLVVISGTPDNVASVKEHLEELAESFMDDIESQYQPPQDRPFSFEDLAAAGVMKEPKGFVVRGGPWEKKGHPGNAPSSPPSQPGPLDTNNAQDFPAFGLGSPGSEDPTDSPSSLNGSLNGPSAWGRKRN